MFLVCEHEDQSKLDLAISEVGSLWNEQTGILPSGVAGLSVVSVSFEKTTPT
jgi:hypothetical protein